MDAQMSHYPPPDQHYSSAYPAATGALKQDAESAIEQLQPIDQQSSYGGAPIDNSYSRVEESIAQLQNHAVRATEISNGALAEREQHDAAAGAAPDSTDSTPKSNRLRKACDSCSIRKVKCDEQGPPCRACANLDIPCTFERPSRRRGPPNRHAEAVKRRRLEAESGLAESPSSPTHAAQALAALSAAQQQTFTAENIAIIEVVDRLLVDFFTYIHPLAPFPHEPMFMQAFRQRDDVHNKVLVAMIAAMVGAVVVSYPKRLRVHNKALGQRPASVDAFVQNCIHICTSARGVGYLDRSEDQVNTYDAITSYFMGQIFAQRGQLRQGGRYFAEALTILRSCGLQSPEGSLAKQNSVLNDLVHQELAKRLYWRLFIVLKNMQQLDIACPELDLGFSPSAANVPPVPIERDDAYVFSNSYDPQPYGTTSELTGFNLYLQVYQEYSVHEALDTLNLPNGRSDFVKRKGLILERLENVKQLPSLPEPPNNAYQQLQEFLNGRNPGLEEGRDEQRVIQSTVQRAMIEMASISTRFHLVDTFWRVDDAQDMGSSATKEEGRSDLQAQMKEERAAIVKDLIQLLSRVSQTMVEFNLDRFTEQAKRLANALMQRQAERKAKVMTDETGWLTRVLAVLERGQRVANQNEGTFGDEYEDMTWADWRLVQQEGSGATL